MNKGFQAFLGVVLFFVVVVHNIGFIVGYSEAVAFNSVKVETIQRIRETGHDSDYVRNYVDEVNEIFDDTYEVNVEIESDNDGDGQVSYGDVIKVSMSAKGSGAFRFKKTAGQVAEEGRDAEDNLPSFNYVKTVLVDIRE